jgi:uncharacterized membrane protein YkgB
MPSQQTVAVAEQRPVGVLVRLVDVVIFLVEVTVGLTVFVTVGFLLVEGTGFLVVDGAGFLVVDGAGFLVVEGAGFLVVEGAGFLVVEGAGFLVLVFLVLLGTGGFLVDDVGQGGATGFAERSQTS